LRNQLGRVSEPSIVTVDRTPASVADVRVPGFRPAIVAIFRNEAPYLLEWLAHHRAVGFSTFYIADNVSDDGTSELLTALQQLGYLRRIPFPTPEGQPPQFAAYEHLLREYAQEEEWVALIDADEFILPLGEHRDVPGALAALAQEPTVGAIALNWACYGSSWRLNHTSGLVTERFFRRSLQGFGPNHHYKTILRRAAFDAVLKNPHHLQLKPGFRYVRMNGEDVIAHEKHGLGLSTDVLWQGLRVNHYLVKSRQEFWDNKSPKGRVSVLGGTKGEKYFVGHDKNDVGDPVPGWLLTSVKAEVQILRSALGEIGFQLPSEPVAIPRFDRPFDGARAHIDSVEHKDGRIKVSGWAMHWSGLPPVCLALEVSGQRHVFLGYEHRKRSDIVRSFPMACDYCGFNLVVPASEGVVAQDIRLFAGDGPEASFGPFRFAGSIAT
jgi:hypothetical protein